LVVVWRGAAPPAVTRDDVRGAAPPAAAQNGVGARPLRRWPGRGGWQPSDSGSVRHGALLPAPVEGRRSGAGNAGSSGEEVDPVRWKAADLGPVRPDPVAGRWIRRRRPLDGFNRPVDGLGGPVHGFFFHFFLFH